MFNIFGRKQSKLIESTRVAVENLEGRCMMSASPVSLDRHGLLDVIGSRKSDSITVTLDHRHTSQLDVVYNGTTYAFKASKVKQVLVSGGAGNDKLTMDSSVTDPSTLLGGAGDDTITAGGGDDHIDGGTGNDQCNFDNHGGIQFTNAPAAVQVGLTTLAQGASVTNVLVFHDNDQTYYGAVVTINNVLTRIVVDANGTPVSTGDNGEHNGGHHQEDGRRFGMIFAIDLNAKTITVNIASEHGAGRQIIFNVDPSAVITADGATVTLDGLTVGGLVDVHVSGTNPPTVDAIHAFGRRMIVPLNAVDANALTITVPSEHGADKVLNVDPAAVITLDGTTTTLANLLPGMIARIKFSADNTTVVGIAAVTAHGDDKGQGGDSHNGPHGGSNDGFGRDF